MDDQFNESLDKSTDAVISAFDWLAPVDRDELANLMIALDGAISEVMAAYVNGAPSRP